MFTLSFPAVGVEMPPQYQAIDARHIVNFEVPRSIVILGANGTGKTRLGNWLDITSPDHPKGFRISAQRSIVVPPGGTIVSKTAAFSDLVYGLIQPDQNNINAYKAGHKWQNRGPIYAINDYEKLLNYLFSDHAEQAAVYLNDSAATDVRIVPPVTRIQKAKVIWESVLPHRELHMGAAEIKTSIRGNPASLYPAGEMSDGERVCLYLIGQCLSAPEGSHIIVDEPELHIHKSIQYALWAAIQAARPDCLFIFITHDVDFAAAQTEATKIWLKSFDGKTWDWALISDVDGVPEDLLLEVLGARKPVLFVEGEIGSFDVSLYQALLTNFLVMPRGSCTQVISAVKIFHANAQLHHMRVYGIIDRDRRGDEEIEALRQHGIFVLDVAEVENLFCTRGVLALCSERLERDANKDFVQAVNFVIGRLASELETQVSLRVASEIKFRLNLFDEKAKGSAGLTGALQTLVGNIDVNAIYNEYDKIFKDLVENKDYEGVLKFYNRKSLSSQIGKALDLADKALPQLVLRLAMGESRGKVIDAMKPHFGHFQAVWDQYL